LKYVQEQIEEARGGDLGDFGSESESEEEEEEVSGQSGNWRTIRVTNRSRDPQGEFYTEGSDALLEARRRLARYSLSR
jgi:U4/U6 small nuclear ribonucleoprotein PRP4